MNGGLVGAVVVAAGRSSRLGQDKLFLELGGTPVLGWALRAFEQSPIVNGVALVLSAENRDRGARLVERYRLAKVRWLCLGGEQRHDSVRSGLRQIADQGFEWVAIHDGARPLVTPEIIQRGIEEARATGAAVAGVPTKDTIKVVGPDGAVESTPDRSRLWAIQTPQVFRYDLIVAAYRQAPADATDDATLVERQGGAVRVYRGSYDNLKITTVDDLELAESILRRRGRD